jgi:hypothetical protein
MLEYFGDKGYLWAYFPLNVRVAWIIGILFSLYCVYELYSYIHDHYLVYRDRVYWYYPVLKRYILSLDIEDPHFVQKIIDRIRRHLIEMGIFLRADRSSLTEIAAYFKSKHPRLAAILVLANPLLYAKNPPTQAEKIAFRDQIIAIVTSPVIILKP